VFAIAGVIYTHMENRANMKKTGLLPVASWSLVYWRSLCQFARKKISQVSIPADIP
jgi:hypothetical protein